MPGPRPTIGPQTFVNFESGQVRPLALSRDGTRLYAVNTPDNRLEIFSVGATLTQVDSVPVGLEPVAVAEDPAGRVWVVNHLSDSVSVVNVTASPARVEQTLWVGDEPRDIVFAGAARERAFVTTARRGQNSPVDPGLNTPGIGRANVWVFDSTNVDDTPGGSPLAILTLFGDRPRPLAVSPDGLNVYAGIFLSGNQTTSIAPDTFIKSPPTTSADGIAQPDTGLIARFAGLSWVDDQLRDVSAYVPFTLPDYDVFEIDAVTLQEKRRVPHVGTILFNMAVNPASGKLYVSNLDSRNSVRFAGVASRADSTVRGHVTEQQISVIDSATVSKRRLNKHLDFSVPIASNVDKSLSVSTVLDMAVSNDGTSLYATAFGSNKLAVYNTQTLEDDSFVPSTTMQIAVSGGGPSGIVLDEARDRAYVHTRFDNGISVIDIAAKTEVLHLELHNPEPAAVRDGRKFLYDATLTSGNGNDSCASCHVFGDTDGLAWDLGEPDETTQPIPNVFIPISPAATPARFHPLKGPMTTQSMRGLRGHGPMHWRGDRTGNNRVGGETLEEAAFKEFNAAFDAFAALGGELNADDMQTFTDFAMGINYPPNPIRQLDNGLIANQIRGEELFNNGVVRIQTGQLEVCRQCHTLNPAAGLFGTRGLSSDNSQPGERNFKIPHFRDQYQKVGMFGFGFNTAPERGPQVRGFSFNHNGATSSNFIIADLGMPQDDLLALRAFLYAFPTESPPILGQQLTFTATNAAQTTSRVSLLIQRGLVQSPVRECDLVAQGVIDGERRGWLMDQGGDFLPDRASGEILTRAELESQVDTADESLTFMCVPWGSGVRIGLDRDLDGILNGDE
ncbi:MAG: hypothetical protein HKN59_03180 [Gammaproteobacteria bacterium]|nr:hypothetical protein [Gammaproteobacteria bacterium]